MAHEQIEFNTLEKIKSMAEIMKNVEAIGYANRAIDIRNKFSSDRANNYPVKDVPKTAQAAFDLMVEYSGTILFLILQIYHLFKDANWHEEEVIREISEIELFIKNASTVSAIKAYSYDEEFLEAERPPEYEYIRIQKGYYLEQPIQKIELFSSLSLTYARCFMYLPFLRDKLQQLQSDQIAPITLKTVCIEKHYTGLIQQLHTKGFIDKDTSTWVEKGRGVRYMINALLTVLENKGYIIDGIIKPEDRCRIVKNTFNITISKETTKRQPSKKYIDTFNFIKSVKKSL